MPRASKAEPREEQEVSTSSADEPPIVLPNKNLAASGPLVSTAITIVTSSAGRQIIGAGDGSKSPRRERFDSSVVSAVVDAIPDVVSGEAQKSIDPPGAESSTSMRNGELEQRADGNAARALERLATLSIQDTRPISGVIGSVCVPPHPEFDGNISDVTRHLNTLGSVDTVHDSDEASDLCNVDVDTALQSAMSVVKNLLLRQLMDCTSSYAMDSLNETNIATSSKADRSSISSSGSSTTNSHTTSAGKRTRKRERRPSGEDGDDDDEEEDEDDRPKKRSDGDFNGRSSVPHMRLKCPFYQRQPEKYTKSACSHSEYPDMPRLKQHIRRVHTLPPKCPRCKQKMASVEACDKHLRAEPLCEIQLECPRCQQNMASAEARDEHLRAELICENKNELQGDLIDPQVLSQELNLRRKAYSTSQTIEDQWTTMFKALFGDQCSVPSPYGQSSISPQLEQALCEALVDILSVKLAHIMGPIMTEIKGCLPDIIESCRQKLKGSPSSNARDRRRTDSATSSSTKDLVEKPSTPELDVHPEQEPTTPSAISVVDNVPTIHPQHLCLEDDDIDHGVQTINPSILGYHSHDCYNVPGSNVVLEGSQGSATSAPVGVQPGTFQPTLDFTSIVAPFTQGSMFDPYSVEGGGLLQPLLSSADSLDPSFAAGDTEWDYTNPVQVQSGVANPEAMEQLNWETWPSLLN
ncbi:hypothetical protein IQ06DRAFT_350246 [Phaeosphaeriaceae sp. SRC1lsM3a]|nr:hypothetical protein IQ06DRAFT_350246 [Stagonospora sp. SRC1lsM3a]